MGKPWAGVEWGGENGGIRSAFPFFFLIFIRAPALPSVLSEQLKDKVARMAKPGHG